MLKIRLIGKGRWGTNIYNTLKEISGVDVFDPTSLTPGGLRGAGADAVIIATPGSTHAEIALPFVKAGLPVFIEKPMTTDLADAKKLQQAAKKSGSQVFVGHIHLYNPAFIKARQLVKKIGKMKKIYFEGMAPGPVRDDMSVWWDWGPHGVSMAMDILGKAPASAQAWGNNDATQVRLSWPNKVDMFCSTTWLSPEKRTKLTVIGSKGSVVFDDRADNKVALYLGDKVSHPRYGQQSPLNLELKAFVKTIETGKKSATDINNGLAVVKVLAAAEKSMNLDGKKVKC